MADALRAFHAADRLVSEVRTRERHRVDRSARVIPEAPPPVELSEVSLDLLALTADYPVEHPLRQAAARLIARLALLEGKIATATARLEPELEHYPQVVREALEILKR